MELMLEFLDFIATIIFLKSVDKSVKYAKNKKHNIFMRALSLFWIFMIFLIGVGILLVMAYFSLKMIDGMGRFIVCWVMIILTVIVLIIFIKDFIEAWKRVDS